MDRRQRNNYAYASDPVLYQPQQTPAVLDQAGLRPDTQYHSNNILINNNGVQPVNNNAAYSPVYYYGCPCGRRRCRRSCGMVVAAPASPLPPPAGPLAVLAERRGGRRCACGRGRGRGRGKGYGPISLLVDGVVGLAKLCADKSGQKDKKNDVVEPVRDRANVEEREEKAEFQHEHDDYDDEYDDNHEREHFRQYQHHSSEKHTHVCEEDGYADAEPPSYQVAVGKSQKNPGY